jgi:hypothetical protein
MASASDSSLSELISEAWETGLLIVRDIGSFPVPFTECIRSLLTEHTPSDDNVGVYLPHVSRASERYLFRLIRAPSLKLRLYIVMRLFFTEKIHPRELYSDVDLLSGYSRYELASLIALIVLTRRIERRADTFYWEKLAPALYARTESSFALSHAFQGMQRATTLLVAALRILSLATFSGHAPLLFQKYYRHLLHTKKAYDWEMETSLFGCAHTHVGALLLQSCGFGVHLSHAYYSGATTPFFEETSLNQEARDVRGATLLLDKLVGEGILPESPLIDGYRTSTTDFETLQGHLKSLRSSGGTNRWLMKRPQQEDEKL